MFWKKPTVRASAAALAILWASLAGAAEPQTPFLIELFTALGCSSCPPADENLVYLARRKDTVALAFHVNYWDSSWPDHFALPVSKSRQEKYRVAFRNQEVYTPQMVIDGALELPGNSAAAVAQALAGANAKKTQGPAVTIKRESDSISVGIDMAQAPASGNIWLAVFDAAHTEEVKRGENRGRTIVNVNIVRQMRVVGQYTGAPWNEPVALDQPLGDQQGVAVFVQPASMGRIIAVGMLSPPA